MAFAVIIGVVGLCFLVSAQRMGRANQRFLRVAERTSGEIVGLRRKTSTHMTAPTPPSDGTGGSPGTMSRGTVYYPTVTFAALSGATVTAESKVATNPAPGRVGETVGVLYDPADPQDIRIDTRLGRANWAVGLGRGLGGLLVVVAIIILVAAH